MTEIVISNLHFRRVLGCVPETYKPVDEISDDFDRKYPPSLEVMIRVSNLLRRKVFNEKYQRSRIQSLEKELDKLHENGYVEMMLTSFYEEALPMETKFYRLTNFGRAVLAQLSNKKK